MQKYCHTLVCGQGCQAFLTLGSVYALDFALFCMVSVFWAVTITQEAIGVCYFAPLWAFDITGSVSPQCGVRPGRDAKRDKSRH